MPILGNPAAIQEPFAGHLRPIRSIAGTFQPQIYPICLLLSPHPTPHAPARTLFSRWDGHLIPLVNFLFAIIRLSQKPSNLVLKATLLVKICEFWLIFVFT